MSFARPLTSETTGIKCFNGHAENNDISFIDWKMRIEKYIDCLDDPDIVLDSMKYGSDNFPSLLKSADERKQFRVANAIGMNLIIGHLSDQLAREVGKFKTAAAAWKHLTDNYMETDSVQVRNLLRYLFNLHASTIDDVEHMIAEIVEIEYLWVYYRVNAML